MRRGRFDVAWLSLYDVAEQYLPLIRGHSPATRIVVDSTDVAWVREHRGALLSGDPAALAAAERTQARERAVFSAADLNVAISAADAEPTRQLAPAVPVSIVSQVQPFAPVDSSPAGRRELLFVGNFQHAPNVDAAIDFHRAVWPLVRAAVPDAHLVLAGTSPPPEVVALAGDRVTVTGWVPSLHPYLDRARVSIAWLRYGAGVKGKITEAVAAGVPVVTTTVGAEGMDLVHGEHVLIADTPEEFARAVARLFADDALWQRLVAQAHGHLEALLGPEAVRGALRRVLALAAPPRWQTGAEDPSLGETLAGFAQAHPVGAPATLVITVAPGDPEAPQRAYERVLALVAERGLDLDAMADIEITPWPEPLPVPARTWSGVPGTRAPRAARRPVPELAVAVRLSGDPATAQAQLSALRSSVPPEVDTVLLAPASLPGAWSGTLGTSGAKVIPCPTQAGRSQLLDLALEATRAETIVTLGALALPAPGWLPALSDALQRGAVIAAPLIDGVAGLRAGPDGSLWPRSLDTEPLDALALDCLAARRETWRAAPHALSAREGHAELQLAAWAGGPGALAVAPAAAVGRLQTAPVSVVICTRDRAEEITDAVSLLVAHGVTREGGEIIVVDNGSSDGTDELVRELAARHPGVRLIVEPTPGLSHARNAGAAAARNELLCYLDDDARPTSGWREHIAWALTRPGVAAAGGPVCALWPPEREAGWPPPGLEGALSVLDGGELLRTLTPPEIVYGANWAIRRSALRAAGGFDTHLGYSPEVRIGSEEVAVAWRLHLREIGVTLFVPEAAVGHRIDPRRLHDGFVLGRMLAVGIEHAHLRAEREGTAVTRLVGDAREAAHSLMSAVPLEGTLTLEEAFARVSGASAPLQTRTRAAEALGLLAATVLLAGEQVLEAAALRLVLRPEHLRGLLAAPAPAAARGSAGAVRSP